MAERSYLVVSSKTLLVLMLAFCAFMNCLAADLCSRDFCECPEEGKEVICQCESADQDLVLDRDSLPATAASLTLSGCGRVHLQPNTFAHCADLSSVHFDKLEQLVLSKHFYAKAHLDYKELANWTVSDVNRLVLDDDAFVHFPKAAECVFSGVGLDKVKEHGLKIQSDAFSVVGSRLGHLSRSSVYSDAGLVSFRRNRIERIDDGAFDVSVRTFEFRDNTVDVAENNAFSVACLHGQIVGNTFKNQTGSPFMDFGPDPLCLPDPESDPYEDENVTYNVVANPVLEFTDNYFHTYTRDLLNFPGANNVPLGSLDLRRNQLRCDCEILKDFAVLVDFEHEDLTLSWQDQSLERGAVLFRKEFYDSGLCRTQEGAGSGSGAGAGAGKREARLKAFVRSTMVVGSTGQLTCVNPEDEKRARPEGRGQGQGQGRSSGDLERTPASEKTKRDDADDDDDAGEAAAEAEALSPSPASGGPIAWPRSLLALLLTLLFYLGC